MSAIGQHLESIVGSSGVCSWDCLNEAAQQRIYSAFHPQSHPWIVYPQTQTQLAQVMTCAYENHWRVLPCGSGSKLAWGGLADRIALVISTARMNQLIDHAVGDLTVTVEAGMKFADLQFQLAQENQGLAIDPSHPHRATLGGIVATADTGALRQRYGGIRDMLIGLSLVRSDGQMAKAGGRVVKNVAGYDLMKLFTGSYGTLGIISQVTFRVYPLAEASRTVVLLGGMEAIAQATQTLLASALTPTAVELITPQTATHLGWGTMMGLVTRFQNMTISVETQAEQLLRLGQAVGVQGIAIAETAQLNLWDSLRHQIDTPTTTTDCLGKFGVLPAHAVTTLDKLNALLPGAIATLHAASGLGMIRCSSDAIQPQTLLAVRQVCQAQGGFFTILEAPVAIKQQMDVWGYTGNALYLMQNIKKQFDPKNLLNPHRFVSGI